MSGRPPRGQKVMKEVQVTFAPCVACARLMRSRGVIGEQPMRAAAANRIYAFASPLRGPLDDEQRSKAGAIHRDLRRYQVDLPDPPALMVADEVASVYRPFVPCGACQCQLAQFGMRWGAIFLSPALKARLAPFVNPRRGKLSKAAKEEAGALLAAAIWDLDRALMATLRATDAATSPGGDR